MNNKPKRFVMLGGIWKKLLEKHFTVYEIANESENTKYEYIKIESEKIYWKRCKLLLPL